MDDLEEILNTHRLGRELDLETLIQLLFDHERAFCENVLGRLTDILNDLPEDAPAGGELRFNIATSMLYDIDETLAGSVVTFQNLRKPKIRPAALFLFDYLNEKMPNVKIGVLTTRMQEMLDKQLVNKEVAGTLAKISHHLSTAIGLACVVNKQERNGRNFTPAMYPEWQADNDVRYLLTSKLNYTDEDLADFFDRQLPRLEAAEQRLRMLTFPFNSLPFPESSGLSNIVNENFSLFDHWNKLRPTDVTEKIFQDALYCALSYTEEIAIAIDGCAGNASKEAERKLNFVHQILSDLPDVYSDEIKGLIKDYIELMVNASWEKLAGIDEQDNGGASFDPEVTSCHQKLAQVSRLKLSRYSMEELHEILNSLDFEQETAYSRLRKQIWKEFAQGVAIMTPEFADSFIKALGELKEQNFSHLLEMIKMLGKMLGVEPAEAGLALQRLGHCKRQLDEGAAYVSIAIDNLEVAAKMDKLFRGEVIYNGKRVDAIKLFGLPEEYRGRLYLIHVGEGAEFSFAAFRERVDRALAA